MVILPDLKSMILPDLKSRVLPYPKNMFFVFIIILLLFFVWAGLSRVISDRNLLAASETAIIGLILLAIFYLFWILPDLKNIVIAIIIILFLFFVLAGLPRVISDRNLLAASETAIIGLILLAIFYLFFYSLYSQIKGRIYSIKRTAGIRKVSEEPHKTSFYLLGHPVIKVDARDRFLVSFVKIVLFCIMAAAVVIAIIYLL